MTLRRFALALATPILSVAFLGCQPPLEEKKGETAAPAPAGTDSTASPAPTPNPAPTTVTPEVTPAPVTPTEPAPAPSEPKMEPPKEESKS